MNMKRVSAAVAGVLAGGLTLAANAGVTVFGHLDEALANTSWTHGTKTTGRKKSDTNLVCTTCSIGFKGGEDLGNGLKAIFKLDYQFDINNRNSVKPNKSGVLKGTGAITDRDQWLGLAGENWGKIRFGTISTGYKSTGAMIDPVYRTAAQARAIGLQSPLHLGAGENGQGRMTNHIRYDSPSFSGFKAIVDYSLDSNGSDGGTDNAWAVTGVYKNGPILGFGSYITNGQGGKDSAWKLGGSYKFGDATVFGQYENDDGLISEAAKLGGANIKGECRTTIGNPACTTASNPNDAHGADVWHIGGTYAMGNNILYAAYGHGSDVSGKNLTAVQKNTSYKTYSVIGIHVFSKRTLAYLGYVAKDNDENSLANRKMKVVALGMKHKF